MVNMEYNFEKMSNGKYQVRLAGEFVCYAVTTDPDYVDEKLMQYGFNSREEFFNASVEEHLAAL
jgi:hypothetical protein